ncbi:MAG: rhodanese-like domain-containing protein [Verrucomicrobia bacterium]|nr:rhodanese-like domain-containing protein [Verrucomicrobiota bacterium]
MRMFIPIAAAAMLASGLAAAAQDAQTKTSPTAATAVDKAYKNVGVDEFEKLAADKKNVVLDVRTPKEFAAGHIKGAVNIDFNAPDFEKKIAALAKDKTYLVHCAGGVRSSKACAKMGDLRFKHLVNLEPGFKAWEKAGKAVEK